MRVNLFDNPLSEDWVISMVFDRMRKGMPHKSQQQLLTHYENVLYHTDMAEIRYIAIVNTDGSGAVEFVTVADNQELESVKLTARQTPAWVMERVALLRLCEVNRSSQPESIGRKFSEQLIYVYLNKKEYDELFERGHSG